MYIHSLGGAFCKFYIILIDINTYYVIYLFLTELTVTLTSKNNYANPLHYYPDTFFAAHQRLLIAFVLSYTLTKITLGFFSMSYSMPPPRLGSHWRCPFPLRLLPV